MHRMLCMFPPGKVIVQRSHLVVRWDVRELVETLLAGVLRLKKKRGMIR
jgi:hypothetical protein